MSVFLASRALWGLQACGGGSPAPLVLRDVVRALAAHTDLPQLRSPSAPPLLRPPSAPPAPSPQAVSMALVGLARLCEGDEEAAAPFLDPLVARAVELVAAGGARDLPDDDLGGLVLGVLALLHPAAAAPGTPAATDGVAAATAPRRSRYAAQLSSVYAACAAELATRRPAALAEGAVGGLETSLRRQAVEAFRGDPEVTVNPHPCFLHGIQADIVLTVRRQHAPAAVVNIEVDGAHHQEPRWRRVAAIRDAHLLREGVRAVVRWDGSAARTRPSPDEFREWLHAGVRSLRAPRGARARSSGSGSRAASQHSSRGEPQRHREAGGDSESDGWPTTRQFLREESKP